jgi:hypothetical protein
MTIMQHVTAHKLQQTAGISTMFAVVQHVFAVV